MISKHNWCKYKKTLKKNTFTIKKIIYLQFRTNHFGTKYFGTMKFYNREKEFAQLNRIAKNAQRQAQMTVLVGRRRVGKTQLLLEAFKNQDHLYFFVARKSEVLLCQDFTKEIERKFKTPILGKIQRFTEVFEYVMQLSEKKHFTLIIDEFQDFSTVNSAIFSEIQQIWDLYHTKSKLNLIFCGSVYTLMRRIFQESKEPLFGRASHILHIKPFETSVLKQILADYNLSYTSEDLLSLYTVTGGVPKYVQLLLDNNATNKQKILNYILQEESLFLTEGKNLLITEFGKEYGIYFSILATISEGKTSRNEIENLLNREIGGYLTRLEKDYNLIKKQQPLLTKSRTKQVRYTITDPFLRFWFRFFYKFSHLIEIGNLTELKAIIERDYPTFSGWALENYFKQQFKEQQKYSRIGNFWDRKGENEIDLITIDEKNKIIQFFEIKRQSKRIIKDALQNKAQVFLTLHKELSDYKIIYKGLSIRDL